MPELLQTYTRRKAAKERAKQTEGVQHNVQDNKTSRETTKMALPQFEREKKNYTPCMYNLAFYTYSIPQIFFDFSGVMNCIYMELLLSRPISQVHIQCCALY